jgi:hypothetical protein
MIRAVVPAGGSTVTRSSGPRPDWFTRAFSRTRGFAALIDLEIWGLENAATLFVRPL